MSERKTSDRNRKEHSDEHQIHTIQRKNVATVALGALAALCLNPSMLRADDASQTPSFDKRAGAPTVQVSIDRIRGEIQLEARIPGVRLDYDPITATPAWIWRFGFLSGPTEAEVQRTGGF